MGLTFGQGLSGNFTIENVEPTLAVKEIHGVPSAPALCSAQVSVVRSKVVAIHPALCEQSHPQLGGYTEWLGMVEDLVDIPRVLFKTHISLTC